ncbi:MAG: MOSC domain-containing protein [Bdellovibrionales bacterium]
MSRAQIKELYVYPIKSLRGVRLSEVPIEKSGPALDRQFMIVDKDGQFITQRTHPEMAKIGVSLHDNAWIELSLMEHGQVDFGLGEHEPEEIDVKIFKSTMKGQEVSPEVSEWLSEVLKQPVRLVSMVENGGRVFDAENFPEQTTRFTDARPLLVISDASLDLLEQKIGSRMSMARFRPNVVVQGCDPHAEDSWGPIKMGRIQLEPSRACTRCKITTVHPLTGQVGEEPLKTLGTYRQGEKGIEFGYYYVPVSQGSLRTGDMVE